MARIEVTAASGTVIVGAAFTVTAKVIAEDGSQIVDRAVLWGINDSNLATVTSTGNLTASVMPVREAIFVISARLDGKSGFVSILGKYPAPVPARAFLWSEAEGFTVIPLPGGATAAYATALNATGAVVGTASSSNLGRPFLWTKARGTIDIGLLPEAQSCVANGISDTEEVVGECYNAGAPYPRPFRWTAASGMSQLGLPSEALGGTALGVNTAGEVSGAIYTVSFGTSVARPARWDRAGTYEALQAPAGAPYGYAVAINETGTAVGPMSERDYYSPVSSVLWRRGPGNAEVIDPCNSYGCYSYPSAISNNGRVTGTRQGQAYSWSQATGFTAIIRTVGSNFSRGEGINDAGQVAVNTYFNSGVRGSLVSLTGTVREIGLLPGTSSTSVTGLNNSGQVAGTGN